jgi:hypothetical protein
MCFFAEMTIAQKRNVCYNGIGKNCSQLIPKGDCTDMKKRICCILLWAVVLAGLIPAVALTASAAVDGMWTTYRFANDYCEDTCDHEDEPCYYCPVAGYKYTHEGFTVVPADYVNYIPRLSVMSKEAQPIKEGVYLKFRVDDYSYDGGNGADQWIALTLTTEEKVAPGTTNYGGGWMTLIRGIGNGNCAMVSYLADPSIVETFDPDASFTE